MLGVLLVLGLITFFTYGTYINFIAKNNLEAIKFNVGITIYFISLTLLGIMGVLK